MSPRQGAAVRRGGSRASAVTLALAVARASAGCSAAGRHQQPDLVLVGRPAVEDGDDPAAVHDRDPVGQLEHLVELGRDEQDRGPRVALRDRPGGG